MQRLGVILIKMESRVSPADKFVRLGSGWLAKTCCLYAVDLLSPCCPIGLSDDLNCSTFNHVSSNSQSKGWRGRASSRYLF